MKRSRAVISDDESTPDHKPTTIDHGPQQEGLVNSDTEQEDDIVVPDGIKLPVYYPLSRAFKHQFRSLSYTNTTKAVDTFAKQLEDTLDESVQSYIDNKLLNNNELLLRNELTLDEFEKTKKNMYKTDEFIQKSREILQNLSEMRQKQETYSEVFRKTKTTMLERDEEELTIENLPYYQNLENPPLQMFELLQDIKETVEVTKSVTDRARKLQFETKVFVSINPTEPLPFSENAEDQEDDDLSVDGGIVNLTCPVSKQIMKNPVKSLNCKHTFDRDSIRAFLHSSRDCPECGAPLSAKDLVEDKVVGLRVACFHRDEKLQQQRKKFVDDADEDKL